MMKVVLLHGCYDLRQAGTINGCQGIGCSDESISLYGVMLRMNTPYCTPYQRLECRSCANELGLWES